MPSTLLIVLPVFGLILAGWIVRRFGILSTNATTELNRFVVYLALPALLFDVVAHVHWSQVWQPGFIAAFGLSCLLIFGLTVALRLRCPRHLADAAIDGLNAGYANVGFIGFPLTLIALGREALAPTMVAMLITVCVVFAAALVLIELGLQNETQRSRLVLKLSRSLLRNPLLVAPALGGLVALSGLNVPDPAETFLKLLGGAATPCALVALGLFLAEKRPAAARHAGSTAVLVGFKLVVQPMVAWVLATLVFGLSPLLTHAAVLLAALPTGTGPFILAELYRREADLTSSVVLVSTVASIVTVSGYLAVAG